jgi:hypothetical protein
MGFWAKLFGRTGISSTRHTPYQKAYNSFGADGAENRPPIEARSEIPADNDRGVGVAFTPWIIDGDDVVREYKFRGISSRNTETIFQVGCTIQMGSLGFLHHHVFFALQPAVTNAAGFLSAFLGTIDDSTETGFFPIEVAARPDGSNIFLIREQQYADKCLAVLGASETTRFLLMDMRECIVKLELDNDPTFLAGFNELQDRKLGRR